jgi:hypothetical protein
MKKLFIIILLISMPLDAPCYETNVHWKIADYAIASSQTEQYLLNNLGIKLFKDKFKADIIYNYTAQEWIEKGSQWEDDIIGASANLRFMNHFYDPTTGKGLNVDGVPVGDAVSSLIWGRSHVNNLFNWTRARNRYYTALTTINPTDRNATFAYLFRSLGQLIHLVHDKAVPAHVRNDGHFPANYPIYQRDMYEKYTKDAAKGAPGIPPLKYDGYAPVDLVTFSTFDSFWTNNGKGLAEFTNSNFVSRNTNIDDNKYALPVGIPEPGLVTETVNDPESGEINVVAKYLLGYVTDQYRSATAPATRLSAFSYFDFEAERLADQMVFSLNDRVHRDYADFLLPRAVGYSAGLLNYFFRGSLSIMSPSRFVYAVADGSQNPQQFTKIKAQVLNTTPNESIGAGTLQAIAKYKKRINYQPDLSADPPTEESREADFSYSVSASISVTSLSTWTEFTFDFTGSPIPAGITDLYLFVVFKGTLGNETDTAIAVGMKDLKEPLHATVWNSTDRFYLDHVLYTADEIKNNPALLSKVDHNGDGVSDENIDPANMSIRIGFNFNPWADIHPVEFYSLPPGRYGRMILLVDTDGDWWIEAQWYRGGSSTGEVRNYLVYTPIINQDCNGEFCYTDAIFPFRNTLQHGWMAYAGYYPDNTNIWSASWPAPADSTPFPLSGTW